MYYLIQKVMWSWPTMECARCFCLCYCHCHKLHVHLHLYYRKVFVLVTQQARSVAHPTTLHPRFWEEKTTVGDAWSCWYYTQTSKLQAPTSTGHLWRSQIRVDAFEIFVILCYLPHAPTGVLLLMKSEQLSCWKYTGLRVQSSFSFKSSCSTDLVCLLSPRTIGVLDLGAGVVGNPWANTYCMHLSTYRKFQATGNCWSHAAQITEAECIGPGISSLCIRIILWEEIVLPALVQLLCIHQSSFNWWDSCQLGLLQTSWPCSFWLSKKRTSSRM